MATQTGRNNVQVRTCNDVNKFPQTPHAVRLLWGSLRQQRSPLWISPSHLTWEDSPIAPIANIKKEKKVKPDWDAAFSPLLVTSSKNNTSSSGSVLIKDCEVHVPRRYDRCPHMGTFSNLPLISRQIISGLLWPRLALISPGLHWRTPDLWKSIL